MSESKYLINEYPLVFQPTLAKAVGINQAIFIQQLHFLIYNKIQNGDMSTFRDGYMWVFNSIPKWHEKYFWFWSEKTVERTIAKCEEKGFVISRKDLNFNPENNTKWYRLDYQKIEKAIKKTKEEMKKKGKSTDWGYGPNRQSVGTLFDRISDDEKARNEANRQYDEMAATQEIDNLTGKPKGQSDDLADDNVGSCQEQTDDLPNDNMTGQLYNTTYSTTDNTTDTEKNNKNNKKSDEKLSTTLPSRILKQIHIPTDILDDFDLSPSVVKVFIQAFGSINEIQLEELESLEMEGDLVEAIIREMGKCGHNETYTFNRLEIIKNLGINNLETLKAMKEVYDKKKRKKHPMFDFFKELNLNNWNNIDWNFNEDQNDNVTRRSEEDSSGLKDIKSYLIKKIGPIDDPKYKDPKNSAGDLWKDILIKIKENITNPSFNTWFKDTYLIDIEEDTCIIEVPNDFIKDWLESRYLALIQELLYKYTGQVLEIEINAK